MTVQDLKPMSPRLSAQLFHHISYRWPRQRGLLIAVALFVLIFIWTAKLYGAAALEGFVKYDDQDAVQVPFPPPQGRKKLTPHPSSNASRAEWTPHNIPPNIWQISLHKNAKDKEPINPENLQDAPTWLAMNPDYYFSVVSEEGGGEFVRQNFADEPDVIDAFERMPNVGMKSDLLRYLLLNIAGGVYTDTDTIALKPIDDWVPAEYRDKAKVIVGIEFDRLDGGPWADINHWVQFCQWTIAAAPGHDLFRRMTKRILRSLEDLSELHELPIDQLKPTSFEVMNSTGPAAWTDIVFEQLQLFDPSLNDTKDLSGMTAPKLYGDILVLTIDGFGMGQVHSHSTNDGSVPKAGLVKHLFRGSWREGT